MPRQYAVIMLCLFVPTVLISGYAGYALTKLNIGEQLTKQYLKQNAKYVALFLLGMLALSMALFYFLSGYGLVVVQLICGVSLLGLTLHAIWQRRHNLADGIGSCSELVQTDDGRNEFGRYAFLIDSKFMNGDVTGQVLLMNPTKGTQEIA